MRHVHSATPPARRRLLGRFSLTSAVAAGALVALIAGAAPAQAAPFAYVANEGTNTISQFNIGAGGSLGALTPATVATSTLPFAIAVNPAGTSVYVTNASGASVSQFDLGVDGTLTPKSPATVVTGNNPRGVAVSRDGASVYVTSAGTNNIYQYSVGAGGVLTPKSPATVAAVSGPVGIAVSPDGTSVYVANNAVGSVSQYNVGVGGALSPKSPATVPASSSPFAVAVSPNGTSVYVANNASTTVSQYDVGAGGVLTAKSPATVTVGGNPTSVGISPDGASAYVTNGSSANVSQFNVGAGGVLTAKSPATVATGTLPTSVVVSPDGASAYVTSRATNSVYQYDVGPTGPGLLSPKSPATVPGGSTPRAIVLAPLPYERPASAPSVQVALVPVFKQCGTGGNPANASHSPPLSVGSCNPPKPSAVQAVAGPTGSSTASMSLTGGDVSISLIESDIRTPAGADYDPNGAAGGDLKAGFRLRATDQGSCQTCTSNYTVPATATDADYPTGLTPTSSISIDCVPNGSAAAPPGSDCNLTTTANTLTPGFVVSGRQTILQVFRVRVNDSSGAIFQQQGIFVP